MKKIILINTIFAALLAFSACSQSSFDDMKNFPMGEKVPSTISIAELKTRYMSVTSDKFTAERIVSEHPLVINGIVTSTDIEGNVYKYIALQEEGGEAIRISLDASGLASLLPIGQRISVTVNNWCIGKYGDSPQIGTYYIRPKDGRLSPGAIPMPVARNKIVRYGLPDVSAVVADTMTIAQMISKTQSELDYRLICIKNAHFTGQGFDYGAPANIASESDKIFAPGTNGIGFPQSRVIDDGSGKITVIATSEYALFSKYPLPASTYVGNITAIVSWYSDRTDRAGNYQLTLRTLSDLGAGFEGYLKSVNYTK
ncbi:MAG: DUF5689 domain-containing protein [Prevotellaceae bacterium]|jgi:hypothetical protein|nr:DUF5689 domain-containing protein [Prevotellaceae bacterium]